MTNEELQTKQEELEKAIKSYTDTLMTLDDLTSVKDSQQKHIIVLMQELNLTKATADDTTITRTSKTTFKYTDEQAIINYLMEHNGDNFIQTKLSIQSSALNKKLKDEESNKTLVEALQPYYTKNISEVLSVKKN